MINYRNIILATGIILYASCGDKGSNKLPTDIVNISATASGNASEDGKPQITFEETSHNFGVITEGEHVEYNFKFKNTGTGDLLIVNAAGSCGCTVPEYPKEMIRPGAEGVLKVKFDSKGKDGVFDKSVLVTCNTEPRETKLVVSGEVKPKND